MRYWLLLIFACLTFSSHHSRAGSLVHGPYRIHYTAIPSTLIPAEVASRHGIKRSENTILVNVSLHRADKPVLAEISGSVVNLLEQQTDLVFKEVNEQDAIYYLAIHIAMPTDLLRFIVVVTPPIGDPATIKFMRRYD